MVSMEICVLLVDALGTHDSSSQWLEMLGNSEVDNSIANMGIRMDVKEKL